MRHGKKGDTISKEMYLFIYLRTTVPLPNPKYLHMYIQSSQSMCITITLHAFLDTVIKVYFKGKTTAQGQQLVQILMRSLLHVCVFSWPTVSNQIACGRARKKKETGYYNVILNPETGSRLRLRPRSNKFCLL